MLNEKQKNLVEENYNLIYKYAKDHKLDIEDSVDCFLSVYARLH